MAEHPSDPMHPFDPMHPPTKLPSDVRQPLMWWMGVRLLTDHQPRRLVAPWQAGPVCRACGRPWPCPPHRLGTRGLLAARQEPPEGA
jgi:hypothetical protein